MFTSSQVSRLSAVELRANQLLDELGIQWRGNSLRAMGYSVSFDRRAQRLGAFYTSKKMIKLSSRFAVEKGLEVMEDVIRHEIAHALDHLDGGYARTGRRYSVHGSKWKMWAVRCGAEPTRLYEGEGVDGRYKATCTCGHTREIHRLPKKTQYCGKCYKSNRSYVKFTVVDSSTGECVQHGGVGLTFGSVTSNLAAAQNIIDSYKRVDPVVQTSKYTGTCPTCGRTYPFHRKVSRNYICRCSARTSLTFTKNY